MEKAIYVKVGGVQYALKGNLTVSPSAVERAGIAGQRPAL